MLYNMKRRGGGVRYNCNAIRLKFLNKLKTLRKPVINITVSLSVQVPASQSSAMEFTQTSNFTDNVFI